MADNKKTFDVDIDGKAVKLAVKRPDHRTQQAAQLVYNRAFREAVKPSDGKSGSIVRASLESVLRDQKLWDDAKQAQFTKLNQALLEGERKLAKGGIKASEAREVAIQMRRDRWDLRQLLTERNSLDLHTAEAQAENARFNYIVSACTVYPDTGKPFWKSEDDYLAGSSDDVALKAASAMGNLVYNLDEKFEEKLPENSFLLKYGFANKDLHLVDKAGRLVDAQGRRVDEKGRLVNDKGELVDAEGNFLTEDGDYKFEFEPFLDEDGDAISPPEDAKTEATQSVAV